MRLWSLAPCSSKFAAPLLRTGSFSLRTPKRTGLVTALGSPYRNLSSASMSTPYPGQKSALNVVLGTMSFAAPGTNGARVSDPKEIEEMVDLFLSHGHRELDAARFYGAGTNEQLLGNMDWKAKGVLMETKLFSVPPELGLKHIGDHSPESIRKFCQMSLDALKTDQVEMWYLHGPDHRNSFEDSLRAVNELYKEGKFKRLGISNYTAWEVAEIVGICERHGWVKPTAYEGLYNAIHRAAEPELFPCLRKFGIAFYEYNPLGGGFFTGRYTGADSGADPGSRFDSSHAAGTMYRKRYWNDSYFEALAEIKRVGEKHGLTLPEIALRWINHHSLMKREHGDSILIGASRKSHLEQNLVDLEKGPLRESACQPRCISLTLILAEEVVKVLDDMWDTKLKGVCSSYAFDLYKK
ncbi:unnamed protein product [Mycena citricolor]|uniref:NADP-dependent oxidoreductase domain-containing protein n=1 Tax=Mycena citricolor TaxID=2018698 RepID=A0AAD2HH16_9AGAR|nr:unnamed protein product [Mycena citricolor]